MIVIRVYSLYTVNVYLAHGDIRIRKHRDCGAVPKGSVSVFKLVCAAEVDYAVQIVVAAVVGGHCGDRRRGQERRKHNERRKKRARAGCNATRGCCVRFTGFIRPGCTIGIAGRCRQRPAPRKPKLVSTHERHEHGRAGYGSESPVRRRQLAADKAENYYRRKHKVRPHAKACADRREPAVENEHHQGRGKYHKAYADAYHVAERCHGKKRVSFDHIEPHEGHKVAEEELRIADPLGRRRPARICVGISGGDAVFHQLQQKHSDSRAAHDRNESRQRWYRCLGYELILAAEYALGNESRSRRQYRNGYYLHPVCRRARREERQQHDEQNIPAA